MTLAIADLFEHAVDVAPERTALVVGDRRLTYRELEAESNRLAHHLLAQGVVAGSHVGIYAANGVEHVVAMLAAFKVRAVPININYRYVEAELDHVLGTSDVVALIHERTYSGLVSRVFDKHDLLQHLVVIEDGTDVGLPQGSLSWADAVAGQSAERDFEARTSDDLYILYTGGTTGYPKGVMWRHEDVWRTLGGGTDFMTNEPLTEFSQSEIATSRPPRISFPISPLMHGAAVWSMLRGMFEGAEVNLIAKFDAAEVWRTIERRSVQSVFLTGDAMARPLIEEYRSGTYDGSSLQAVASSAAIFSSAVKRLFIEEFPELLVTDSVGASEMGMAGMGVVNDSSLSSDGALVRFAPTTVVLDESNQILEPADNIGVVGKIARRGAVAQGYYKDPVKSAQTFIEIDGERFAVPGDFARIESETTLTLLGRGSNCINTGGEKVYPEEVERALKSHPAILDALVVGIPDPRFGQQVTALVEAREGTTPVLEEVRDFLREHLSNYKLPRELLVLDTLPRHVTGKANYPEAQRIAQEESDSSAAAAQGAGA